MENINIFHNSQDVSFRNPFGAVLCGSKIFFRIDAEECDEVNLELIYFDNTSEKVIMKKCLDKVLFKGEIDFNNYQNNKLNLLEYAQNYSKQNTSNNYHSDKIIESKHSYIAEVKLEEIGVINYYFSIRKNNMWFYYGNNEEGLGGIGKIYYSIPKFFQITVYEEFEVPSWYKEGIIYQIFVDSFYNGFEDSKQLNIKRNSFLYGDWYDDPIYIKDKDGNILRWAFYGGNLEGVIKKLPYLKSLGVSCIYLNPIFEATSVHKYDTGDYLKIDSMFGDDEKFGELCSKAMAHNIRIILDGVFSHTGADSVYFNKYGSYSNIGAFQSENSPYHSWYRFKKFPNEYECWWGIKALPNVNELEMSYMNFIITSRHSVLTKWVNLGASGWRLDVADELPDEFISAFKYKLKEVNNEAVLIGEVWEDASNKVSYGQRRKYLLGKELDSVMNYPFRNFAIEFFKGSIDSFYFNKRVMSLYENYPKEAFYANMNLLGTHDTERLFTIFLNHTHSEVTTTKLLKLASLLQFTFPGVPCIYYGDEAGLTGGTDPLNRKAYPWNRENGEIQQWYKKITKLRSDNVVFRKGSFKLYNINEDILCFERSYEKEKILVILNRSITKVCDVSLSLLNFNSNLRDKLNEEKVVLKNINGNLIVEIMPLEAKVYLEYLQ